MRDRNRVAYAGASSQFLSVEGNIAAAAATKDTRLFWSFLSSKTAEKRERDFTRLSTLGFFYGILFDGTIRFSRLLRVLDFSPLHAVVRCRRTPTSVLSGRRDRYRMHRRCSGGRPQSPVRCLRRPSPSWRNKYKLSACKSYRCKSQMTRRDASGMRASARRDGDATCAVPCAKTRPSE